MDPTEDADGARHYAERFDAALTELSDAYPRLLSDIEATLARGFDVALGGRPSQRAHCTGANGSSE